MRFSCILILACLGARSAWATPDLSVAYAEIRARATALAGEPGDIPKRAPELYKIYIDSNRNYTFPLIALHGALWGNRFFHRTDIAAKLQKNLEDFSTRFKDANRHVFIDTYTNYYFSKEFGTEPGADQFVASALLLKLVGIHARSAKAESFTDPEKRDVFEVALYYEQELTVAPIIEEAVKRLKSPLLVKFALKPLVRFRYFPFGKYFEFKNFADREERIRYALQAHDIAVQMGWDRVEKSVDQYGLQVRR